MSIIACVLYPSECAKANNLTKQSNKEAVMTQFRRGSGMFNRRDVLAGVVGFGAANALSGLSLVQAASSTSEGPAASTEYGRVRGVSANGVLSFRGVPYGGRVDGANRFLPPTKPAVWKQVRDSVRAGPRAIQAANAAFGKMNIFDAPMIGAYFSGGRQNAPGIATENDGENCLVLNVLTPGLKGKRPVMVYIHGGGFAIGSGALTLLSERFVAEQDVVLVGVNHRLNVFGYTYLADLDSKYADSGNAGQLDLIAALHWVRTNIGNFGGDASNVTIFGESGGGGKVSTLMAMPDAKGLFHRAIIESGSMLSVRTKEAAIGDTKALMTALGLTASQVGQLETIEADKLLAAATKGSPMPRFGPVVDGRSIPHQTWKPGAPPEAAGVALIVGNCKDESTLFSLSDQTLFSLDWAGLAEREVKAGIPREKADALIAKYRADYPTDSASDMYFRISADRGARRNAIAQAQAKVDQKDGSVFMYNFAWDTPAGDGKLRAFHTAELPLAMRVVLNPEAEELSKQIAGAWAGFARSGNPNHAGLPQWDPYTSEKGATMVFDVGKTALVLLPAHEELAMLAPYPAAML
jgi:para-nitrobenzyl esterase